MEIEMLNYNRRFDFSVDPASLVKSRASSIHVIVSSFLRESHTFQLYAELLSHLDCDAVFLPFEIEAADEDRLAALFHEFRKNSTFKTIMLSDPFKQRVHAYIDRVTDRASRCGAVNLVSKTAEGVTGDNLDGVAFEKGMMDMQRVSLAGHSVLFLGCGGVSSAVATAMGADLKAIGISDVDEEKALRLKNSLSRINSNVTVVPSSSPRDLTPYSVIYNGTGLGKGRLIDRSPLLDDEKTGASLFIDANYTPPVTKFLGQGIERGAAIVNGKSHMFGSTAIHCGMIAGRVVDVAMVGEIYGRVHSGVGVFRDSPSPLR